MTEPRREKVKEAVLRVLARIAPEAELGALDPTVDLRDQIDIDSMDFLNFAQGLHKELAVDVPELDYARLRTLDGCVAYLEGHLRALRG